MYRKIERELKTIYVSLQNYKRVYVRKRYSKYCYNLRKNTAEVKPLTKEQKQEVRSFWENYGIKLSRLDYFSISLDSSLYGTFDARFIPERIFYTKIDLFYSNPYACSFIDNKNLYDILYIGTRMPISVIRKVDGVYQDSDYNIITEEKALDICLKYGRKLVIKPSIGSSGGINIHFWEQKEGLGILQKYLNSGKNFVVQELLKQHEILNKLHPDSINTVRIMTLIHNNQVLVLSSFIRMGVNGNKVDNSSSGGIACGLNKEGVMNDYAYFYSGKKVKTHPTTGTAFSKSIIPNYKECVKISKLLARRVMQYTKLVSWDFAISEDGNPILIESNLSYGGVEPHQMMNGPILGKYTEEILSEVFKSKYII